MFERALGNELYAPLFSGARVEAAAPTVIGTSARAEVRVHGEHEVAVYQLGMVQEQRGEREGLWTLSGLFREGVDL